LSFRKHSKYQNLAHKIVTLLFIIYLNVLTMKINVVAAVLLLFAVADSASAQPFSLPKLPYAYDALEPHIDAQTMEIHHSRHHQAYITNANKALAGTTVENMPITDLLIAAGRRGDVIRNNAGGHYNHQLFWEILSPRAKLTPSGDLQQAILTQFGSLDSLKKAINQAASTRFGSGWAWLIVTPEKKLKVTSTPNQDNPIMDVAADRGIPILGIDVWEHAYYLKFQNKRGDYLGAIWNVLDWNAVEQKYDAALSDELLYKIEKDAWTALGDFHRVLSLTFHAMEDGNLNPIRERSAELHARAQALKASKVPASFDSTEMIRAMDNLVTGANELHRIILKKGGKDDVIKTKLAALHDTFHIIQGLCTH
jgi:superoxide dismutase